MMSRNNIKIIQQILKKQNRYDLAVKLDNCYYDDTIIDGWNGGLGEINIFVHPNNIVFFNRLEKEDRELLVELFDSLPHEYISSYRYSLLEKNLEPFHKYQLDIEYFHASYDNKYVRDELFEIISTFEQNSIKIYSYILEKPKVEPLKRKDKDIFYIDNLKYSIQRLLDKLDIDTNFIIITDRLPLKQNKKKQIKALKEGIKEYITTKELNIRYDIFHHCSASSVNLQVVDYLSWAIFRKYERADSKYYNKIQKYILEEELMTEKREKKYYEV